MGKTTGRRAYDLYDRLPDGIRRHADTVIRTGARATRGLRDRRQIETKGRAFTKAVRRRLRV